jgi:hypothetical protein
MGFRISISPWMMFSSLVREIDASNAHMQSQNALVTAVAMPQTVPHAARDKNKNHSVPSQRMSLISLKPMQS